MNWQSAQRPTFRRSSSLFASLTFTGYRAWGAPSICANLYHDSAALFLFPASSKTSSAKLKKKSSNIDRVLLGLS